MMMMMYDVFVLDDDDVCLVCVVMMMLGCFFDCDDDVCFVVR